MVEGYAIKFKLTHISPSADVNIAINICIFLPRVILVGPFNEERASMYGPFFVATLASITLMMGVIFVEPVFCSWLYHYGGHLVFDISLVIVLVVAALNFGEKENTSVWSVYFARPADYESVPEST